jgi:hypothetical protein
MPIRNLQWQSPGRYHKKLPNNPDNHLGEFLLTWSGSSRPFLAAAASTAPPSPLSALGALGGYLKRGVEKWEAEQRLKQWEQVSQ